MPEVRFQESHEEVLSLRDERCRKTGHIIRRVRMQFLQGIILQILQLGACQTPNLQVNKLSQQDYI